MREYYDDGGWEKNTFLYETKEELNIFYDELTDTPPLEDDGILEN